MFKKLVLGGVTALGLIGGTLAMSASAEAGPWHHHWHHHHWQRWHHRHHWHHGHWHHHHHHIWYRY